jgi:hypothetical protein
MTETPTISVADVPSLVARWLEIGYPNEAPTPADAWHSALLGRLLAGKDPLPEPPPLAFSYPWYGLIENGRAEGYFDLHVYPEGVPIYSDNKPSVMICQSRWVIEQALSHGEYIVVYEHTGLRCRLSANGKDGVLVVL